MAWCVEIPLKAVSKSSKLANVCYDIRGPVLDKARQMEEEGQKVIKLNIGNLAVFGLEPPEEIVQDMIRNLPHSAGYTDSKGLFAPRKAVVQATQSGILAMRRSLSLHARAQGGEARDVAKRRGIAKGVEADNPLDDPLLN